MRIVAGPLSLVETPEALIIQVRSGGLCGAAPAGPQGGGRLLATRDSEVGEPTHGDAEAREALIAFQSVLWPVSSFPCSVRGSESVCK